MKILNFGSLNIDYVYSVEHFVRPGETITADKLEVFCGGKGLNQSVALARAGAEAYHAGMIGAEGTMLTDMLSDAGADVSLVKTVDGATGHAIIQVDRSGQNCIIINGGANRRIDDAFIDSVLEKFDRGDILLVQNEISGLPYLMKSAHARGMRIAMNPSPLDGTIAQCPLDCVDWFLINEIEGEGLTGRKAPEDVAAELLARYPGSAVVLTLGKAGVLYTDDTQSCREGIYRVTRVDSTGAGDTFTGFFLAGVAAGLDIPETLRRASVASSISVSRKGAAVSIPSLDEVLNSNLERV